MALIRHRQPAATRVVPGNGNTRWLKTTSKLALGGAKLRLSIPLLSNLGGGATFARNSIATVIDHNGEVQECYPNEARFQGCERIDHQDGIDYGAGVLGVQYVDHGASDGILIEEESENNVLWSTDLNNAGWNYYGDGAAVASGDAWQVTRSSTSSGQSLIETASTSSLSIGEEATLSMLVKQNGGAGTVVFARISLGGNGDGSEVTLTNEYQVVEVTFIAGATGAPAVSLKAGTGGGTFDILVKDVQLETKAYRTSFIPTSGTAVTRLADDCQATWPDGLVNDFVVSCDVVQNNINGQVTNQYIEVGNDASNLERVRIDGAGSLNKSYHNSSATSGGGTAGTILAVLGEQANWKLQQSSTQGMKFFKDNAEKQTETQTGDYGAMTKIGIGQINAWQTPRRQLNGTIKNIKVYEGDMTDEQVEAI